MNFFKIFSLSTFLFLANCSFIGDKFFSKSEKEPENNKEQENKEEQQLVTERVYDEDKNLVEKKEKKDEKKSFKGDFLQGDIEMEEDYPNLANVPERPDYPVSIEEQKQIIEDLRDGNIKSLDPIKSLPIEEDSLAKLSVNKNNNLQNHSERTKSIRDLQNQKLVEFELYTPKVSDNKNREEYVNEEEEELHKLSRALKNIKSQDEVLKLEKKIQKNILDYSPREIANILGVKGLDDPSIESFKTQELKSEKSSEAIEVTNNNKKDLSNKNDFIKREVPIARISFPHGSSRLTDEDLEKIKSIAKNFNESKGKKLVIVGHASSRTVYDMDLTKHALVNFNMSLERATTLIREFSLIGLQNDKMEMIAMSDAQPLYAEIMPKLEAANRRAEIFIKY